MRQVKKSTTSKKPLDTPKSRKPLSVIDKWLHFENKYRPVDIQTILGMDSGKYTIMLSNPADKMTINQMEIVGALVGRDILEVFYAAYKKPTKDIAHDLNRLKVQTALDQLGIE